MIPVKAGNLAKENETTLVTVLQVTPVYVSFSDGARDLQAEVRVIDTLRPIRANVQHVMAELTKE